MSIESGTIAAKLVGVHETKTALSGVLEDWGEDVPSTFRAYPTAFNNIFTNLDDKIDAVSGELHDEFVEIGLSADTSANVSGSLPYDAELEYIEKTSTSESYFDTGFTPLWNDTIQSKWSINENKSVFFYMARSGLNRPSRGFVKINTANTFRVDRVLGSTSIATNFNVNAPNYTLGTWFEAFDAGTGTMMMHGLDCGYNGTPNSGTAGTIEGTMRLFSAVGGGSWSSSMRFGYMRIFSGAANDDTAVLKLDLIPVRVGNVAYVYDRISKTLISHGGANDFVCGPDKRRTAVAVGSQAGAEERSVAIGSTANAVDSVVNKFGSVAIGDGAKAVEGVAIGPDAEADCSNFNIQGNAVAIGKNTYAKGISIAIGTNAQSGKRTNTNAYQGISIGRNAGPIEADRDQVIDIAFNTAHPSMNSYSIGIGGNHGSTGDRGIAIGYSATASGTGATSIGESSNASGDSAICYGRDARASGKYAMALGYSSRGNAENAVAIGKNAQCTAANTIAIGSDASPSANALSGSVQFWNWTAFKRNEDNTNLILDPARLPDEAVQKSMIANQWEEAPSDVSCSFSNVGSGFTCSVVGVAVNRIAGLVRLRINIVSTAARTAATSYIAATIAFTGFTPLLNQFRWHGCADVNRQTLISTNSSWQISIRPIWAMSSTQSTIAFTMDLATNSFSMQ